jgi:hypothetical protein
MCSLKLGHYSSIFKHFILNTSGHIETDVKCSSDPSLLIYGLHVSLGVINAVKTVFLNS